MDFFADWVLRKRLARQRRQRRLLSAGLFWLAVLAGALAGGLLTARRRQQAGTRLAPMAGAAPGQRVPLAPRPLLERLLLAIQFSRRPGFLQRASGPTTATHYADQSVDEILDQLDQAARAAPGGIARKFARYTSYLKHAGIVGWADVGHSVVLQGWIDDHEPVISSDGMLTIDARVIRLWIDGQEVTDRLDGPRHLRIEVFAAVVRSLPAIPRLHDCIQVEGLLRIDHDGLDFYEVHPPQPDSLRLLDCGTLSFSREPSPPKPYRERLLLKIWPFD